MTEPAEYVRRQAPEEIDPENAAAYDPGEPADPPIDADPADYADQLREAGIDEEDLEHG